MSYTLDSKGNIIDEGIVNDFNSSLVKTIVNSGPTNSHSKLMQTSYGPKIDSQINSPINPQTSLAVQSYNMNLSPSDKAFNSLSPSLKNLGKGSPVLNHSLLPTDGMFKSFNVGSKYLGDDGQVMISQKGLWNDRPMTESEFTKFAETHPEASAQAANSGLQGFDAIGKAITTDSLKPNDSTILGLDNKQWNSVGQIGDVTLGLGQLGLGVMSYFQNKATADKQRQLLGQQYENNVDLIQARKDKRENIRKMFS